MPECTQCGQPVSADGAVCDACSQREFARQAEAVASDDSQQHFLITNVLLAINVAVFVLMLVKHVPLMSPTADQVVKWGGNFGPLTLGGQSWRLLTNVFLHIGLAHIIANMWALIILGRLAESLYGRTTFLAIYLLSGIAGSLASLLWNPMGVSAGASGALLGMVGALIASLYAGKLPLPKNVVRPVLISLIAWAGFVFIYGFWKLGVDNAAHVGGFISGLLLGLPLGHHLGPTPKARDSRQRVFIAALVLLSALSFITWRTKSYVVYTERARVLINANKVDDAIQLLLPVAQKQPKEGQVHLLLGDAYLRKQDFASAEREFKRAVELVPKNIVGWSSLGDLYLAQRRFADAAAAYTRAAEQGTDNGLFWYKTGILYNQLDRPQDAVASFQKSVAKNPYLAEAWFNLGLALMNVKQPAQAVQALQKTTGLQPNNAEAHLWLGNAMNAAGQQKQAEAEFLRAFQLRALQQKALQEAQRRALQGQLQHQKALQNNTK